jgi:hypothetical protein
MDDDMISPKSNRWRASENVGCGYKYGVLSFDFVIFICQDMDDK